MLQDVHAGDKVNMLVRKCANCCANMPTVMCVRLICFFLLLVFLLLDFLHLSLSYITVVCSVLNFVHSNWVYKEQCRASTISNAQLGVCCFGGEV